MVRESIGFVDLFCGGGLGSRGAVSAGCSPVAAVDLWKTAVETYRDNFPQANAIVGSVEQVDISAAVGNRKVDLLLASPECTNHSVAKGGAVRDDRSKETAFYVLDWLRTLEPRWAILENVIQMRTWARYVELKRGIEGLGYGVRETVIDASWVGVPQARRRFFMLCDRERVPGEIVWKKKRPKAARSILDPFGTWETTPLFSPRRASGTVERAKRAIDSLGPDKPFLIVYYGSDGSGGWQSLDSPLRTVTTLDRFALVEKVSGEYVMRMLQPTELARAMGLPQSHRFNYGTRRDKVRLCGNGVCAPVMEELVRFLVDRTA